VGRWEGVQKQGRLESVDWKKKSGGGGNERGQLNIKSLLLKRRRGPKERKKKERAQRCWRHRGKQRRCSAFLSKRRGGGGKKQRASALEEGMRPEAGSVRLYRSLTGMLIEQTGGSEGGGNIVKALRKGFSYGKETCQRRKRKTEIEKRVRSKRLGDRSNDVGKEEEEKGKKNFKRWIWLQEGEGGEPY